MRDEDSIVAELAARGYGVSSLAELRKSYSQYTDVVPLLVAALSPDTTDKALMEVVRALSVPWARPTATAPLASAFENVGGTELGLRWAVGNALSITWDDTEFDRLVALAQDRAYGRSREMLVIGLSRSKRPEAVNLLVELLEDPDVNGHAVKALRKMGVPESARPALQRLRGDQRVWVRKEVERALSTLSAE